MIYSLLPEGMFTKRMLLSQIGRLYDNLVWYSLALINPKIPLQWLWEDELVLDDSVSPGMS